MPAHLSRHARISLLKVEAISKLAEVCQCLRELLARLRRPGSIMITGTTEPDAYEWDEDWSAREDTPQARFDEMMEGEARLKEKRLKLNQYLADEHRAKLLEEDGIEPDAETFKSSPPDKPKSPGKAGGSSIAAPPKNEDPPPGFEPPKAWNEDDDDDEDDAGGIAELDPDDDESADEHWLPAPPKLEPNQVWLDMNIFCTLTEDGLWTHKSDVPALEYLQGIKAGPPPMEDEDEDKAGDA